MLHASVATSPLTRAGFRITLPILFCFLRVTTRLDRVERVRNAISVGTEHRDGACTPSAAGRLCRGPATDRERCQPAARSLEGPLCPLRQRRGRAGARGLRQRRGRGGPGAREGGSRAVRPRPRPGACPGPL